MANGKKIALMIYGDPGSARDALTEEKYKELAASFVSEGFAINSILYNDDSADKLSGELLSYDAILVWVNPIEKGKDRKVLDSLLAGLAEKGCFVSAHPDTILKMGTKEVLYMTRKMEWGCDTNIYKTFGEFMAGFPEAFERSSTRVLKQYRGNGGNGVFKIAKNEYGQGLVITHAAAGNEPGNISHADLFTEFKPFFSNQGFLIDQEWNNNTLNGMVRCYVSGEKVAGFGYQEINALYELNNNNNYYPPSKRYYYTENCGLFSDLKMKMEIEWIPQLQEILSIPGDRLPVIWDADFFINTIENNAPGKYTLCEINTSSVSPFPPSAISFIVENVKEKTKQAKRMIL